MTTETVVISVDGRGLDSTESALKDLEYTIGAVYEKSTLLPKVWGKVNGSLMQLKSMASGTSVELALVSKALKDIGTNNPYGNIKLDKRVSGNVGDLDRATRSLIASSSAVSTPLGRSAGALMRVRDVAKETATALRSVGVAYGFLSGKAAATNAKGVQAPALATSYGDLTKRIQETTRALDALVLSYGKVTAAQTTVLQNNKKTFPNGQTPLGADPNEKTKTTLGKFASSVGGYIARFGTAAGVVVAGREIASYEDNIAELGATLDVTGSILDKFRETALSTARATRIGITDVSEAMVELAKAGVNKPKDIAILAPVVSKAAIAGRMNASDTTTLAVNLAAQFKKNTSDIPALLGKVTKAANLSVVGFQDIGISMKYAGEAAASLGTDFDQTLAAIATLGQVGKRGSTGGTSLRQAMTQLAVGNEKVNGFLDSVAKRTGADRDSLDITKNSLVDVLTILQQAEPTARDLFATFEKQGGAAFIALINNLDMLKKQLAQIRPAGFEEVERVADRMNNTLGGQARRMVNSLMALFANLNSSMGDPFKTAFSMAADFINWVDKMTDSLKGFMDEWPKLGGLVKTAMGAFLFKGALSAISTLTGKVVTLGSIVAGLGGAFTKAAAGAKLLSGASIWGSLKANAPAILALAAYQGLKSVKTGQASTALDETLDIASGAWQELVNEMQGKVGLHKLTGIEALDSAVYRLQEIEEQTKKVKDSKKGIMETTRELQLYAAEKAKLEAFLQAEDYESQTYGKKGAIGNLGINLGGVFANRDYIKKKREEEFKKAKDLELQAQFEEDSQGVKDLMGRAKDFTMRALGLAKRGEDIGKAEKPAKRNADEILAELMKATQEMDQQLRSAMFLENEIESARRKIVDSLRDVVKARFGLEADQKLPEQWESFLNRIRENPAETSGDAQTALLEAMNSGKASVAELSRLRDMNRVAEIGLIRDMISESERQQKLLESMKSTAESAYKEVENAAQAADSRRAKGAAKINQDGSLAAELSRTAALYEDKTKAILDYADALDKATLSEEAASARNQAASMDVLIFRIAKSEQQKLLESTKTASDAAFKTIESAAAKVEAKRARSTSKVMRDSSLESHLSRTAELYKEQIDLILKSADALDKAGFSAAAMAERQKAAAADGLIFGIAKDEAAKNAAELFRGPYDSMMENLKSPFEGSTILELLDAEDAMKRVKDQAVAISEMSYYEDHAIGWEQMTKQIELAEAAFERFNKLAEDRRMVNWAKNAGFAMIDVFGQGVQTVFDSMIEGGKDMEEVFKGIARSIVSALFRVMVVETLVDTAKAGWKSVLASTAGTAVNATAGAIGGSSGGLNSLPDVNAGPAYNTLPDVAMRSLSWPTAANSGPQQHAWLRNSSGLGRTNHPPMPTEPVQPTSNPDGSVNDGNTVINNQTFNIKAPDPHGFRRSKSQIGSSMRRLARG